MIAFVRHLLAVAATVLCACSPRVGSVCPPEASALAHTVVYRRDGLPAYAGQALMITTCGGGAFCHSEDAASFSRYGAPIDLNFDPQLADQVPDPVHGAARLRRAQVLTFEMRDAIFDEVVDRHMPPRGVGGGTRQAPYVTFDGVGNRTDMPGLDTATGRVTLRNWLACGAPVIERIGGLGSATACSSDADCTLTGACDLSRRQCIPVGETVPYLVVPIDPTWASIYDVVISSRCAQSSCHGGTAPAAGLDLSNRDAARTTLLGSEASPDFGCHGQGPLLVAGNPDTSLFFKKLNDPTVCGGAMPRGGGTLASRYLTAIHDWIAAGAPP